MKRSWLANLMMALGIGGGCASAPVQTSCGSASQQQMCLENRGQGSLSVTLQAKLTGSDQHYDDSFGCSVALSGDTALIGAYSPIDSDWAPREGHPGSAYIFVRSGAAWTQQAKVYASDMRDGDRFGWVVALSGDTAAIATAFTDSVYVFERSGSTWHWPTKLRAEGVESMAISGNTLIVGTQSSAHVFERSGTTWLQQTTLTGTSANRDEVFGESVAISGDTAVVGAPQYDSSTSNAGSVYVFTRTGTAWAKQAKLTPMDSQGSGFGSAVALSGSTLLVGSKRKQPGTGRGAAYVFVWNGTTWAHQARLTPSQKTTGEQFGHAVALSGDIAVIGTPSEHEIRGGKSISGAYVFMRNGTTWTQQARLDSGGDSVAISEDTVAVGYPNDGSLQAPSTGSTSMYVVREAKAQPPDRTDKTAPPHPGGANWTPAK